VKLKTGGRIDMGHHDTKAHLALDETVEFAKAVQAAVDLTDEKHTLIVVTADHAHTLSISGYPVRGNNIFGKYDYRL
jgi:alkaline phosphatase